MGTEKAIFFHGTFLHLFHQRAEVTGFSLIHAGPDQRLHLAHRFLLLDPTKDERCKIAGFLQIASLQSDIAPESGFQSKKLLIPPTIWSAIEGKMSPNNALMQPLPFAVLVFPNPPVEVTAIVVMDGVSKDTMALLICSRKDLQEWFVGPKLILCPQHARSVGVPTDGGGVVTLTVDGIPGGYRHPCIGVARGCGHCVLRRSVWRSLEAS
jgi:hypothetical protein